MQPSGTKSWIVKLTTRGKARKVTLGNTKDLPAHCARGRARALLAEAATDGLPKRRVERKAPSFAEHVEVFWADYARHWKPSTAASNRRLIDRELVPNFGPVALNEIRPADVLRWRDGLQMRPGVFNRSIPVFASVMKYAEQLGHRAKGSNPCKGMPRFRREPMQRFLSPKEYARLGRILREHDEQSPVTVAAIRMLLYTGARRSEIEGLTWREVEPGRLRLADSKTGPKTIYLNTQAEAVLRDVPRRGGCDYVFPNASGKRPLNLDPVWLLVRREAALPDVRLHDLRHSFASVGVAHGFGLPMIARLLGHAELDTTARYAHLADQSVSEAAERVSSGLARCLGMQA